MKKIISVKSVFSTVTAFTAKAHQQKWDEQKIRGLEKRLACCRRKMIPLRLKKYGRQLMW